MIPLSFTSHETGLKRRRRRHSRLKNVITSSLPHIPSFHHRRFFSFHAFIHSQTPTPLTSRSHKRLFGIEDEVVRFRRTFSSDDSSLRCFSTIDPIAAASRNFLREDRNLSMESAFADANFPSEAHSKILVSSSIDKNSHVDTCC